MLKVKFTQTYEDGQSTVSMEVLEQDENIKGKEDLFSKDGLTLKSYNYPELRSNSVFVRGEDFGTDNKIATITFDTIEKSSEYIVKAFNLIEAYNESLKPKISPFEGEVYWYITKAGKIQFIKYCNSDFHNWNYQSGNYYKTEKQAENSKQKTILLAEMQRFADKNNSKPIDWSDSSQQKYYLYLDNTKVRKDYMWSCNIASIHFTKNCIDEALNLFGERFKKYVCGISDEL